MDREFKIRPSESHDKKITASKLAGQLRGKGGVASRNLARKIEATAHRRHAAREIYVVEGARRARFHKSEVSIVGPFKKKVVEHKGASYELIEQPNGKYKLSKLDDPFDISDYEFCKSQGGRGRRGLWDACMGGPSTSRAQSSTSREAQEEFPNGWDSLKPEKLYRGDTRSPSEIFREGFHSKGTNMDKSNHLSFRGEQTRDKASGYISTTRYKSTAATYAFGPSYKPVDPSNYAFARDLADHSKAYLYKVVAPPSVSRISITKSLNPKKDAAVKINGESDFRLHIPPCSIKGVYKVTGLRTAPLIGAYQRNPGYWQPKETL